MKTQTTDWMFYHLNGTNLPAKFTLIKCEPATAECDWDNDWTVGKPASLDELKTYIASGMLPYCQLDDLNENGQNQYAICELSPTDIEEVYAQ